MQADFNKGITSINNLLLTVGMSLKGYKLLTSNASMKNMNATFISITLRKISIFKCAIRILLLN